MVIDAGHGGHDSGCLGASAKEKIVALDVALKLGAMIEDKFPDVNVVYTRKTDEFVELHERAAIANRNHADLFICIHCNSGGPSAFGVETYVMGLHKSEDNLNVAKRENASILLEKDFKQKYDGFDPNSPEANIVFSLYQNAYLTQSLKFASAVQGQVEEYAGRFNRGVKQAGFLVLYRTAMPSVLIETGFLTNNSEEKYLLSEKGQNNVATSIFKAFEEYKLDMETGSPEAKATSPSAGSDLKKNLPELKNDNVKKPANALETKPTSKQLTEVKTTVLPSPAKDTSSQTTSGDKKAPAATSTKTPVASNSYPEKKDSVKTNTLNGGPAKELKPDRAASVPTSGSKKETLPSFFYTVQLAAVPDTTPAVMEQFKALTSLLKFTAENGYVRICQGVYNNYSMAIENQKKLRSSGFSDAFVTPYHQGKRISIKEAAAIKDKNPK